MCLVNIVVSAKGVTLTQMKVYREVKPLVWCFVFHFCCIIAYMYVIPQSHVEWEKGKERKAKSHIGTLVGEMGLYNDSKEL